MLQPTIRSSARSRRQRGAIALMTLILIPILAGFAALTVDVGRMYVFKSEVQNAMDACALAAAAPLNGTTGPVMFDQARAYGLAMSDPSLNGAAPRTSTSVNRLHFQHDYFNQANISVEFSTALAGAPWVAATSTSFAPLSPQTTKFVRCTYLDTNNALFLVPLLGALVPGVVNTMTVAATATATLAPSQSACAFPIAVCTLPGGHAGNNWGRTVGERLSAVSSSPPAYGTGNFGWLDFTPPSGGASEIRDLILGAGSCSVSTGTLVGEGGAISTLDRAWNTRFGVYKNPLTYADGPPDFTGYSYPSSSNNYPDYVTRLAARAPFQGIVHSSVTKLTSAQHTSLGAQRRIAVAAVVDCGVWAGGGANPPVLDFACILLLAPVVDGGGAGSWSDTDADGTLDIEYLGLASTAGSPCASSGLTGGSFGPKVPGLVQ